jgi:hypothetical protein
MRLLAVLGLAAASTGAGATGIFSTISESETLTAVNSKQFNGYIRARLPDGSYQAETFAFGDGGMLPVPAIAGLVYADPTIDALKFREIAGMLAGPLASQNYVRATDPGTTRLLIMVYWGRTIGAGRMIIGYGRDGFNFFNASLLGFDAEAHFLGENGGDTIIGQIVRNVHAGEMSAIEMDRYYVILRAFDFQSAWKRRERQLLWETRFSLSERRHDFERELPNMAQSASLYFGQDSYGLRSLPPVPEGHVRIGEARSIDDLPDDGEADGSASVISGDWRSATPGVSGVVVRIDGAGNSTFENAVRHVALPARTLVKARSVTVIVPGWDVLIRGTVRGDRISGTISEYGGTSPLNLTRSPGPQGGENAGAGDGSAR